MKKEDTMELDKILRLTEAGFTKEDIMSMIKENEPQKAENEPENGKEEIVKESPKKESPKEETKKDEGSNIQEEYVQTMKEMAEEFKKIRDDLKRNALAQYDEQIADPVAQGQKVLAKIIDPPVKAKKKG